MATFGVASAGRILIAVVLVWLLLILFIGGPIFRRGDSDYNSINGENGEMILARLSRATSELGSLKSQNEELRKLLDNLLPFKTLASKINQATDVLAKDLDIPVAISHGVVTHTNANVPTMDYEKTRRKLVTDTNEMWNFLRRHLNSTQLEFVRQHRHNTLFNLGTISSRDDEWRKAEYKKLEARVLNTIDRLQNPKDCDLAKKLVCQLNKGCGFGCQIHHVVYCFIVALATDRTLILDAHNWRYVDSKNRKSKSSGWNLVFEPMSRTCLNEAGADRSSWKGGKETAQVLDLPIIDSMRPRPNYLPLSIPKEISEQLMTLHGSPIAWFLGQITRYIMRPSAEMKAFLHEAKYRFQFRRPIVGIHVRRTDKVGSEAAFHPLSEYMQFVEDYYNQLELKQQREGKDEKIERFVYLATDDPGIWVKETPAYEEKGYTFIGDSDIAQTAGIGTRYSVDSLRNVILDIVMLSECDHLVCTFSSQVCRLAFELMQTRQETKEKMPLDWSQAFYSLDDIYYFGGQGDHNQVAILNHKPFSKQEIEMKAGDVIGIAGNHWNGFSKGVNRKSNENGLYPGFKTEESVQTAPFKAFEKTEL